MANNIKDDFADSSSLSPEHRLIDLCRELFKLDLDISSISFKVEREDGDYQTYSLGRKPVDVSDQKLDLR